MLDTRLDRAPVRRSSVALVWLGMLLVSVPTAGLSITPEPAPMALSTSVSTMASQPADALAASAGRPDATVPPPPAGRPAAGTRAKQQPAALAGTVADQSGRFIPDIPLTLIDATTSVKVETATGRDGRFEMTGLLPGVYQLRVSKPGFKPHESPVELTAGATVRRDVVLHLGTLKETITVSTRVGGGNSPAVGATSPAAPRTQQVAAPPADDPCSQSVGGGCVTPPRKLADVKPIYPARHAQAGVAGEVVIDAVIRPDGSVAQLQPKPDSDPDFAAAAMHAIRLWKFSPTRLNGEPVEVDMTVKMTFQITK